ncbi:MAG TPA: alcohol dehydrogenase catalytic domain-containing protein [Patescibacteria group bacterium]
MKKTMLAVVKEKPEKGVVIKQVPIPTPGKDEILVKVKAASICGTDINIYNWTPWAEGHIKPPAIIGHEVVGEVLEVNSSNPHDFKKGDLVSSETHIFDGRCYQCQIGNRHICENMELFGIGRDGGFAEYAVIPMRTSWKNDKSLPIKFMSTQEPLGNAVNVVQTANVPGKTVVVYGLGPTGLCAIAAAKAYGAKKVIGINRGEYRRKLGTKMGADEVYEKLPEKYYNKVEVILEMSGNAEVIADALNAARIAGTIVFFGIPKKEVPIDIGKYFINKELTAKSVFGRKIWETWYQVSDLLTSGKVDLGKIITHEFALKDFDKAMQVMISGECGKVVLIP